MKMDKEVIEKIAQSVCSCCFHQHEDCPFPFEKPCSTAVHFAEEIAVFYVGFVQLDPDQSLPENRYSCPKEVFNPPTRKLENSAYAKAQQDMLNQNWKKVKK